MNKEKINFKEFLSISDRLEIKMGTITNVHKMEGSDKMLKLTVNFGDSDIRTVMTNIGNRKELIQISNSNIEGYLTYKQFPFVTNLEPAKMMGVISEAMIMIPTTNNDTIQFEDFDNGTILMQCMDYMKRHITFSLQEHILYRPDFHLSEYTEDEKSIIMEYLKKNTIDYSILAPIEKRKEFFDQLIKTEKRNNDIKEIIDGTTDQKK